jgi:hypothetical protein
VGDLFFKTDENAVYVYTSTGWAELAGGGISGLTANRALASDASGDVVSTAVTSDELGFLSGVVSGVQGQIDALDSEIDGKQDIVAGVSDTEIGYLDGVTSGIQGQLNTKQATITGGATTITDTNLTTSRALVSDGSGKVAVSAVTSTELGFVDGVTSNIQTQINAKANTASPTFTGVVLAPQIRLSSTTAASTTSTAQGLQVGSTTTGTRMKFGPNTLQVVTSTSSATTLELQPNGGLARFGGAIDTDVAQSTVNGTAAIRNVRVSTADPSGGLNGDVDRKSVV